MGTFKTKNCFFSNKKVISCEETDTTYLDGYYYRIEYNSNIRVFKLSKHDNWKTDTWLKKHGREFLELIDKNKEWSFLNDGRNLSNIKEKYYQLKSKGLY